MGIVVLQKGSKPTRQVRPVSAWKLNLCWDDVLVAKAAAAPKPRLSPVEMRTLTVAGGLIPANKASIATRIIYYQPRLWFCPTKEINYRNFKSIRHELQQFLEVE